MDNLLLDAYRFSSRLVGGTAVALGRRGKCSSSASYQWKDPLAPPAHPKLFPLVRGEDGTKGM
ncbi:hypothetical protein [Pedobacter sp. JCM 36344]|uniref:hypothetical protein n=1 Tax=Pedobacter sp. JCM 36344 TaxID=3374280 RepID=UPI003978E7EB